jgi:hypothetical protein
MELFKAHTQWAKRPKDERFSSIRALYTATLAYAQVAREKEVPWSSLRVEAVDTDIQLVGRAGVPAQLTHWAFGQLCNRVGAPASYLRDLPATLASQNLNYGLKTRVDNSGNDAQVAKLLFHTNGGLLLRALTSERYERIWNWEVAERLLDLEWKSWIPATPTSGQTFQTGTAPALYASDHDMFAFLANGNGAIVEPGTTEPMYRGVIVENSEVGASTLRLTRFLYRCMCGNHIIWGASKVVELSIRHIGQARERWMQFGITCQKWADESSGAEEAMVVRAKERVIAATKEAVLDAIFGKRNILLPRKTLEAGYAAVVEAQDGPANTVWGMVQGLTRHSQTLVYADARTSVDRAAGKLLEVDF